jgi:anti-sigma factor (TIGR02949 family)
MVCDDVKRIAYFFLDGQLETAKRGDMEGHLGACPDCDGRVTIHRRLRSFVRARLRAIPAPTRLRERLHSVLSAPRP